MKQEQWNPAPPSSRRDTRARSHDRGTGVATGMAIGMPGQLATRTATDLAHEVPRIAPKLTKLLTTKIVSPKPPATDEKTLQRLRLLSLLLAAKGRIEVTRAAEAFFGAGHALDRRDQAPHLQLLEHADEGRVREAIVALGDILTRDAAEHRPVLERRLSRIGETADERSTRDAAEALRHTL